MYKDKWYKNHEESKALKGMIKSKGIWDIKCDLGPEDYKLCVMYFAKVKVTCSFPYD